MMCTQARTFKAALSALAFSIALAGCPKDDPVEPPPSGTGPTITSFTATPTMVARGGTVTLSWVVTKANSITIVATPGGTLVDASTMLMGSMTSGMLDGETSFKLTATGADGKTADKTVTVTINQAALMITSFIAVPNPAGRGATTELQWRTTGATSVKVKEGATTLYTALPGQLDMGSTFSSQLTNPSHTFTLEASNGPETITQTVTVMTEAAPMITSFTADPPSFTTPSQDVRLSWTATDVKMLRLNQNGAPAPGFTPPMDLNNGSVTITVTETTLFELIATSGGGEARAEALVAKTVPEVEPNDSIMTATPLTSGAAAGEISPAADVDFYSFTVGAGGNVRAAIKNADGTCPFMSALTLQDSMGMTIASAFPDFGDDCPDIDPRLDSGAANLAAGTYYVSVASLDVAGPYTLVVIVGMPGCGNEIFEDGELCDDGNTMDGDNCSAQCQFETAATINPPGGMATVSVAPYVADQTGHFRWIQINITQPDQSIGVETSDVGGGCTINTFVALFDATMFYGVRYDDGGSPVSECAAIRFPGDALGLRLPMGTYYLLVGNESETSPATIAVNVRIIDAGCGSGALDPNEQCDDGNVAAGDGCSATCTVEPLGMVNGPGEMTFSNAIDPGIQQDFYAVNLTSPGYVFAQTFAPVAPTCTPTTTDTVVALLDNMFMEVTSDDDGGEGNCSNMRPSESDLLMPGSYWVRVVSFPRSSGPLAIPAYQVTIRVAGVGCGNTVLEMGEQCDDGNTAAGDGCTAMCSVEPVGTIMGPPGNQVFDNELDPISEKDFYRVVLTAPAYIDAETFAPAPGTCTPTTTDTLLRVLADDLTELARNDDIDFGQENRCSHIRPVAADLLQPGNYWVEVSGFFAAIPDYAVRIRISAPGCGNNVSEMGETCDDGNTTAGDGCNAMCQFEGVVESEPNDALAMADPSTALRGRSVTIGGSISPVGDIDVYSITLTGAPSTLSIRTHTTAGDPTVCAAGFDTYIYLKDAMGNDITDNDDVQYPTNVCSWIDGSMDMAAAALAPGTYYVEVHQFDDSEELLNYFLTIGVQ